MSVKVHEAFSIDSFMDRLLWWDDFLGDQLKDEWREVGTGSAAVVDLQTGGVVRITTGGAINNQFFLDWSNIRSFLVSKRVSMEIRVKLNHATWINVNLDMVFDGNNYVSIYASENAGGATNWFIRCRDGGAGAGFDSGIAADTSYHIFRIECFPTDEVHFYIDGVETANSPITTNIPDDAGDYFQPFLSLQTRENLAKSMDIDYVVYRQEI